MTSLKPSDDATRLENLRRYQVLDTEPEQLYDDFTELAAQICDTPISLISLVDEDRQWFKSKVGLHVEETPREHAFCNHALPNPDEILIVKNALEDERFADNPLVLGEPHIRYYAGAPLVADDGYAIGTLCVIDQKPRELTDPQLAALQILARQVVSQMEAQLNLKLLNDAALELEIERRETQLILDHVPAYVFFKDTKNNILRVNKPVTDALGMNIADVEGHATSEIYPDLADQFYADDLEVIESKRAKLGIIERLDADRQGLRWIRTDKIPLANKLGEIERLLVVALDITELKNVEDSLRESQSKLSQINAHLEDLVEKKTEELAKSKALYEDLYQNAPDMHVSVDPGSGNVLQCNQTLLSETGYNLEEVVGKSVFELYDQSSIAEAKLAIETFRKTGSVKNCELTLARKDGSKIDVSLNVSSIRDNDGKIIASRSVWRDITEKKTLERDAKRNAEQLAHLARVATMNEMATGIAHELNQPLHAINNFAQGALLRLKSQSLDNDALVAVLEDIVADADRAAELIKSFRRFVKPSERNTVAIAPSELADRISRLLTRELDNLGAELTITISDDLPLINCDSVQITQVLLNLILNARDATAESPPSDQEIKLVIEKSGEQAVRFAVIDRGPGFSSVDADRMFDAFYTTKKSGLGMGLAICRTIVATHGGELAATENDVAGLTMSFTLPAVPNQDVDASLDSRNRDGD